MPEKKASLLETIKFAKEAIAFVAKKVNRARGFNDNYPLVGLEKAFFVLGKLKPQELKRVMLAYSSYNHGRFILDSVFPKFDNPQPFHSTEFSVNLSDRPVQVLGWQEQREMVDEGVKEGLIQSWIDAGFSDRAIERGIDLEFHFRAIVQKQPPQTSNLFK